MSFLGSLFGLGSLDEATANRVRDVVAEGAPVVDVRTPAEFASQHIPGAINVPLAEMNRSLKRIGSCERPVVIYCASGARSRSAAAFLRRAGFAEVLDVGPMSCWPC